MLKWIRSVRLDFKTGLVVIILTLILWGIVSWARISDFVPEEFKEPHPETPVRVP
jgi:hypothetical protein